MHLECGSVGVWFVVKTWRVVELNGRRGQLSATEVMMKQGSCRCDCDGLGQREPPGLRRGRWGFHFEVACEELLVDDSFEYLM